MKQIRRQDMLPMCALVLLLLSNATIESKNAVAQETEPQAAAGSLDPSFGTGGKVVTDFAGKADEALSVAVQPDGKIVVAGRTAGSGGSDETVFALARYNSDGSLDSSFGSGGKVTADFFQHGAEAFALALQQDGKILVAGDTSVSSTHTLVAIARYNANGTLDAGFGSGGKATVDFGAGAHLANAIAIQTDGKIVLAGKALLPLPDASSSQFGLARLNTNGTMDASFGSGGMVTGPALNTFNAAAGLAIQPNGKIVIVGSAGPFLGTGVFAVVRYNANGTVDTSFGIGGFVTTDFSGFVSVARRVHLLSDDRLVVVGFAGAAQNTIDFALARYNANGSLDTSFGNGGKITTAFPGGTEATALDSALQPDGKIVVAGRFSNSNGSDFALARYNADGTLDQAFGTGGLVTTDINGFFDQASGVALQADSKIVVAGGTQKTADGNSTDFAVLRYLVGPPSVFSLGLDQPSVVADRGTNVRIRILINRASGFSGNVTVTPPDSVLGVKVKPGDPIMSTDPAVSFKLKVKGSAPTGPQQLTFTGKTDDGQVSTTTLTLNIQ